jgi:hypothetical protein
MKAVAKARVEVKGRVRVKVVDPARAEVTA